MRHFGRQRSSGAGDVERAELPGADPADVLSLNRRQLLEVCADRVGQAGQLQELRVVVGDGVV